ncbi:MAG: bifunctional phosphopantothenoylcysteine decarboxylase/phosphopantothenate--cysteine ligase CoaBC [Firmicutes bacterium]|nr:bifunctional phosphopantothenoylcysteine decarboxylase/phosphopantothenate--cysteine ligase CoaBC [Bacillota bacterium]
MRVVVGVGGGIAAYKACELVSRLIQKGHQVRVVMTPKAAQFVAPLTFRALTGSPVGIASEDEPEGPLSHVRLAHWANAMIVAPATAELIARLAQGIASDLLSLVYLGFRGPVVVAPAMEAEMWTHPATQRNIARLRADGAVIVGPAEGRLASGAWGRGRLVEPEQLVEALEDATQVKDLAGVNIVVTAGATWEFFDPVRLLTNPSTGLMGALIARLAAQRGARVALVHGPSLTFSVRDDLQRYPVVSAEDMLARVDQLMAALPADVFIGAAAVSDFRPAHPLGQKAHKDEVELTWAVLPNPDIIQTMAERYRHRTLIVGFAAETDNVVESAKVKRERKGLHAVVANLVGRDRGFGAGAHQAWLVSEEGETPIPGNSKEATAAFLLDWVRDHVRCH